MQNWRCELPLAVAVLGTLLAAAAVADDAAVAVSGQPVQLVVSQAAAPTAGEIRPVYYRAEESATPFEEESTKAPLPDDLLETPAVPPPPPLPSAPALDVLDDPSVKDVGGCGDAGGCGACGRCCCKPPPPLTIGGWLAHGITANSRHPLDRFNGPVTFNDRDAEYQMNQLWVYAERVCDTRRIGFDVGGRVDLVYGTDHRFTRALGLEDDWGSDRFYGLALPQCYLDVAVGNLTVRMGHFYTIIGHEVVPAPNNFFYSHSYTMKYGEPFTHTGLLGFYDFCGGQVTVIGGFDRGWNNWEDNNTHLSFLGGIAGETCDGHTRLAFAISSGFYDDAGQHARNMYSIVFSHQVTPCLLYVMQNDLGVDNAGGLQYPSGAVDHAQWYGINQSLICQLNDVWSFGCRFEWFRDDDGARVGGIGAPHGWNLGPDIPNNQVGWAGDFYALTLGFNWQPSRCLRVRPECRWDWYDGPQDGLNRLPYNSGRNGSQFTFATDMIITF